MNPTTQHGFTFIELILYIGIAAIIITILFELNTKLIGHVSRSSSRSQVQREMVHVVERLKQETHYAYAIELAQSIFNVHPGKLRLFMRESSLNPTLFATVVSGSSRRLTIQQGTGAQQFLTSDAVSVDRFVLYNLSIVATSTLQVRAVVRLKYRNPDNLSSLDYAMTATTSIELMNR